MAQARTIKSVASGFSATVKMLQMEAASMNGLPAYLSIIGPGGGIQYWIDPFPVPNLPYPPSTEIRMYGSAKSSLETYDEGYVVAGSWIAQSTTPPYGYHYVGDDKISQACVGSLASLWVYKARFVGTLPEALSSPCHPLHLVMGKCYGNNEGYGMSVDAGCASDSTDDHTLAPVFAAAGGGTRDLTGLSFKIGLVEPPSEWVDGAVIEVSNMRLGGELVSFDGYSEASGGCIAVGSGSTLTLSVVSPASVPGDGVFFYPEIYSPIIIDYDLRLWNWGAAYGGRFRIPANEKQSDNTYYETVDAPFVGRRIYYGNSWASPALNRPFDITIQVEVNPWMISQDEDVQPPDAQCTIEESDLSEDPEATWQGFEVLREDHIHIQKPEDILEENPLPSLWVAVQQCTSEQEGGGTGLRTTITVDADATYGIVLRTLVEDYFSAFITPAGLALYEMPTAYQMLRHVQNSDIWNLENFGFLVLSYTSELAQMLELVVHYSEVTVHDNHLTGATRADDFMYDRVRKTVVYPLTLAASETATDAIIDLQSQGAAWLQHVDALELRGFAGQPDVTTDFTIEDITVQQYDPTTEENQGQTLIKITFARPGSSGYFGSEDAGLPISYTALTAVVEGARSVRPPDQIVTLCEEAGLDFVEYIRGAESGVIGDGLRLMANWGTVLNQQEGYRVTDADASPPPWDPDHATYKAAFVGSDTNDMLGGKLYCADFVEQVDALIADTATVVPARVRVGEDCVCSGTAFTVKVDHILRGSLHGLGRQSNQTRALAGVALELWEPGYGMVSTSETDDWGHFCFPGAGARENRGAAYRKQGGNIVGAWAIYNRIRQWIEPILELTGPPSLCLDIYGRMWVAFAAGGRIYCAYHTHHTLPWSERFEVKDTEYSWRDPDILCHLDATLTISATDINLTVTRTWVSRDDGRTWDAVG